MALLLRPTVWKRGSFGPAVVLYDFQPARYRGGGQPVDGYDVEDNEKGQGRERLRPGDPQRCELQPEHQGDGDGYYTAGRYPG